jgi:hypothetical protein
MGQYYVVTWVFNIVLVRPINIGSRCLALEIHSVAFRQAVEPADFG